MRSMSMGCVIILSVSMRSPPHPLTTNGQMRKGGQHPLSYTLGMRHNLLGYAIRMRSVMIQSVSMRSPPHPLSPNGQIRVGGHKPPLYTLGMRHPLLLEYAMTEYAIDYYSILMPKIGNS